VTSVLITGAGGFIGAHLTADQLRRGHDVRALDVNLDRLEKFEDQGDRLRRIAGDIRDTTLMRKAVEGVDTIFHLASAHLELTEGDEYFESINVGAIRTLFDAARKAGVKRIVHCSSVGVYGPLPSVPADESSQCNPDILYEMTKLRGEQAVLEEAERTGLSAVILRPAWVYGPGCPRTLKLFRNLARQRFPMVGSGQNLRHPIFVQDMCDAFELAASTSDVEGEILIIAGERPLTVNELVETICTVLDVDPPRLRIPLPMMYPACWAMEKMGSIIRKEPPFSTRSLKFFTENSAFRTDKAAEKLEFSAKVGLAEGLQLTSTQFRSESLI
jgi:nucleoside-diphosphate-sugar epimerase